MPRREDINRILVIGAGPIVIGQACEFDYSGTQACRALTSLGYYVVLINSNPATIMTDPHTADKVYVEPITPEFVEKIVIQEQIDAILPTVGGQTGLNCALQCHQLGILERHNVALIGASPAAIEKAEDRQKFNQAMAKIGLAVPKNAVVKSYEQACAVIGQIGLPAVIRPSFTMGGTGGGIAYDMADFDRIVKLGLSNSPTSEVLIDQSIVGWKEYEMEVVRDKNDNVIIVCTIENVDPMGVHTGDSITVAPAQTLTDKEYQRMRDASIAVIREIGVETGGSNVQFAVNPDNGELVVIEMNPRNVSRSSALASKATGFPIAKVAAKLAVGFTLDELQNDITQVMPASFEPTIDYVVTKIPKFTFEKFATTDTQLSTSMRSVGEVMAIGRSMAESLQKALRSLESGLTGFNTPTNLGAMHDIAHVKECLVKPLPERILLIAQALRLNISVAEICQISHYDPWFVNVIAEIVAAEQQLIKDGMPNERTKLLAYKKLGFADERLAELTSSTPATVAEHRRNLAVLPVYKTIDTCAAEFASDHCLFLLLL